MCGRIKYVWMEVEKEESRERRKRRNKGKKKEKLVEEINIYTTGRR